MPAKIARMSLGCGLRDQVRRDRLQQELDFGRQRPRFQRNVVERRVGRADHDVIVPGNRKDDAAVAASWARSSAVSPGRNCAVEHEVNSLAGNDRRLGLRIVEPSHSIAERTGRVHDDACPDAQLLARFPTSSATTPHTRPDSFTSSRTGA